MTERLHLFATLLILVLSPAIATAQNDKSEPDALRGLSTVDLVVEAFGELPDPKRASEALRNRLEAGLALNKIKAEHDPAKAATLPRLHLIAYVVRSDDFKHYAHDVSLSVSRMVQMFAPRRSKP